MTTRELLHIIVDGLEAHHGGLWLTYSEDDATILVRDKKDGTRHVITVRRGGDRGGHDFPASQ